MRALKSRLKSRVIVTLHSGDAFDGVLWEAGSDVWVLRSATALHAGPDRSHVSLDGEVVLLVAEISYAQKP